MQINPSFFIPDDELTVEFIRSSGPGGQNVNKVATAVRLHFNVRNSPSLPDEVKNRLVKLAGSRMTSNGVLLILANRFRTQEKNLIDAQTRFASLVNKSLIQPKERTLTKVSYASKMNRLEDKKRRARVKKLRKVKIAPDE